MAACFSIVQLSQTAAAVFLWLQNLQDFFIAKLGTKVILHKGLVEVRIIN